MAYRRRVLDKDPDCLASSMERTPRVCSWLRCAELGLSFMRDVGSVSRFRTHDSPDQHFNQVFLQHDEGPTQARHRHGEKV